MRESRSRVNARVQTLLYGLNRGVSEVIPGYTSWPISNQSKLTTWDPHSCSVIGCGGGAPRFIHFFNANHTSLDTVSHSFIHKYLERIRTTITVDDRVVDNTAL